MIILTGVLIRLVLSAATFHSDIVHFDLAGYVLGKGQILNFYDYTFTLDKNDILLQFYPVALFNYPPAVYFTLGPINWALTSFTNPDFHSTFLFNTKSTFGNPLLFPHLMLLKVFYLVFDLLIAYFLYRLFTNKKEQVRAVIFWIFNPVTLYSTYMIGQFDIVPTFFVVLVLYLVIKAESVNFEKRIFFSSILLGIGGSYKIFPLLLLIPLAASLNGWIKRFLVVLLGLAVYAVTILPFLASSGFRTTALLANQTLKSFYAQISISGGESIILFLGSVIFFYLYLLYQNLNGTFLWQRFFIFLLLFFSFTHYHVQWFLWLTPFLIIELISSNFRHLIVVILMLISYMGGAFIFGPSLSLGLFSPLSPPLSSIELWGQMGLNIDYNFSRSIFQTVFVSAAAFFIYRYLPQRVKQPEDVKK